MASRYCLLIPHYRHVDQLTNFLPLLGVAQLPALVVDDGSGADSLARLRALVATQPWAELIERTTNGGKGAATMTGLTHAAGQGFTHVVVVDADGQHDPQDIVSLHKASLTAPGTIFSGAPEFGPDIPKSRLYGRMITNTLAKLEAGNFSLRDAMCGLRLYPISAVQPLCAALGQRTYMEPDTEILVRACWAGIDVEFIPTRVVYPESGRSHFRMVADNARLALMHIRLLLGALLHLPRRHWRARAERDGRQDKSVV